MVQKFKEAGYGYSYENPKKACLLEGFDEKRDMPDNDQAISKNGELVSVAEMAVNILLFGVRGRGGLGRHKPIGHFIRVSARFIFIYNVTRRVLSREEQNTFLRMAEHSWYKEMF